MFDIVIHSKILLHKEPSLRTTGLDNDNVTRITAVGLILNKGTNSETIFVNLSME